MEEKPVKENYGYIPADSTEAEPGWAIEGGEEAYYRDLKAWGEHNTNEAIPT